MTTSVPPSHGRGGRLWQRAGILLSGNVIGAFLGVAVVGVTARGLGPARFGELALIAAGYQLLARLAVVQTGNAIVRYGAAAANAGRTGSLAGLFWWCTRLEWGSAIAIATCAGMGLTAWTFLGAGEDRSIPVAATVFLAPLLVSVSSLAGGILRLADQFRPLALQAVISNTVKLAGCSLVLLGDSGVSILPYALAWAAGELAGLLFLAVCALRAWLRLAPGRAITLSKPTTDWPDLPSFLATGVAHNAVKSLVREGDVLLVGALADTVAAGTYRLLKQVGSAAGRLVDPLQQAMYPDLARNAARGEIAAIRGDLLRVASITSLAFGALLILFFITGRPLLDAILGPGYGAVFSGALIYLAGTAIAMVTVGLHPAALALGLPLESFKVLLISAVIYFIALFLLVPAGGATAAAMAYVIFYVAWSLQFVVRLRTHLPGKS